MVALAVPPVPDDLSADQRALGEMTLRFEDIAQDGRLVLDAVPASAGIVFRQAAARTALGAAFAAKGIVPILARFVIDGAPGPFGIQRALAIRGAFRLAHIPTDAGEVERIVLDIWTELEGPRGATYGSPPAGAGEPTLAARFFAEYVFTRPFAPPDQRKVLRFDVPELPPVPEASREGRSHRAIIELGPSAEPLEPDLRVDETPLVFGVGHTDSNQHVNSLVYPRLFEEAALRRFAALGERSAGLARWIEIGFRKPSFAGETKHFALRAFREGGKLGAVGILVGPEGEARPHCFVKMLFER